MDYRTLPEEWKHSFDRIVSVEMIEAVGKEFLEVSIYVACDLNIELSLLYG